MGRPGAGRRSPGPRRCRTRRSRARRSWFAFLPGVAAEGVRRDTVGDGAALEEVLGGTAVRTGPLTLERGRAAIAPLLADGVDATLYPVTD